MSSRSLAEATEIAQAKHRKTYRCSIILEQNHEKRPATRFACTNFTRSTSKITRNFKHFYDLYSICTIHKKLLRKSTKISMTKPKKQKTKMRSKKKMKKKRMRKKNKRVRMMKKAMKAFFYFSVFLMFWIFLLFCFSSSSSSSFSCQLAEKELR